MKKPRTFEHFPTELKCVVCGTNEDAPCVLLEIDGTSDGKIAEAQPIHLNCAVAERYNKEMRILYTKLTNETTEKTDR